MLGLALDLMRRGGGAAGPAPPFGASEPGAWYDPSDLASMFQNDAASVAAAVDAPVGYLGDLSGNGNHAVQADAARRPVLRLENGFHFLEFDGEDDAIGAPFALAQPWERVSAVRQIGWISQRRIFGDFTTANGQLYQITGSPTLRVQSGLTTGPTSAAAAIGADHVISERHNGAASALAVDAGAFAVADAGSGAANGIMIGNRAALDRAGSLRCYGLMVRGGTMSAGQLAEAQAWMAEQAGVVL